MNTLLIKLQRVVLFVIWAAWLVAPVAHAAPGDLDPTFGVDGKVVGMFDTSGTDDVKAIARDTAGYIYVGGNGHSSLGGSSTDFAVAKYDQTGQRVSAFGAGGKLLINVSTYYDVGTSMVIVGSFGYIAGSSQVAGNTVFVVAKFDLNGQLIASFGTGGIAKVDFGANSVSQTEAISVDATGNVFLAGATRTTPAVNYSLAVAKLDSVGALVAGFGIGGVTVIPLSGYDTSFYALALDGAGGIYAAATRYSSSTPSIIVYRLGSNGMPLNSFGVAGSTVVNFPGNVAEVHALVRASNGDIYVSGTTRDSSNVRRIGVAKLDANGVLASSYGTNGRTMIGRSGHALIGNAMALDQGGSVYVAGVDEAASDEFVAGQFDSAGNIATTFGSAGLAIAHFSEGYDFGKAALLDNSGHLYVAGIVDAIGGNADFGIARFLVDLPDAIFKSGFEQ